MENRALVITVLKSESPVPAVRSVEDLCVKCGRTVWISVATHASMVAAHGDRFDVSCVECGLELAKK